MRELIENIFKKYEMQLCLDKGIKGTVYLVEVKEGLEQAYEAKLKAIDAEIEKINYETKVDLAGVIEKSIVKGLEKAKSILEGEER